MLKKKRFDIPIPPFFRDYLWQPLKAVLCFAQLYILIAMIPQALDGMWTQMSWSRNLLAYLAAPIRLVGGALLAFILWRHYDAIDDTTFLLFVKEPHPHALWKRPTWMLSIGLSALSVGYLFAAAVWDALSLTPLPWYAGQPLSWLFGIGLAFLLRWGMVVRLDRTWKRQRELYDETTVYPTVIAQILYSILLFAALVAFIQLLIGGGVLAIIAHTVYFLIFALFTEEWKLLLWLLFFAVLIRTIIFFVQLRSRRQFMNRIMALHTSGKISLTVFGHPWLSLLIPRLMYGFHIIDAEGQAYNVGVASTGHRRGNVVACDHRILQYMFQIRMRFAPIVTAVGVVAPASTEMGTWHTTHRIRFPKEDGLRSTNLRQTPVETVMLIDPAPRNLYARVGTVRETLDNGSRVYGYLIYTKNAFCRMLERQAEGKQTRYSYLDR